MPFSETTPMKERRKFIEAAMSKKWQFVEVCDHFGISPKTGYKWMNRFDEEGLKGLVERSRRPHSCPHEMSAEAKQLLLELKSKHPTWGARKVLNNLRGKTDGIPRGSCSRCLSAAVG